MYDKLKSNLKEKKRSIGTFIITAGVLFIIFFIFYGSPPVIVSAEPAILNESFIINDSHNTSVRDIIIKNIGPEEISLYAKLDGGNYINDIGIIANEENDLNKVVSNLSKINDSIGKINISLSRYELSKIKSGSIEFLSVTIDASNVNSPGVYNAAIVLSNREKAVNKIIPLTIDVKLAE